MINLLPNAIYNYLKKTIPTIPEFFIDFTPIENEGLVFRPDSSGTLPKYYGDYGTYQFNVFYITNSSSQSYTQQLINLDLIIEKLLVFKKIEINKKVFNIKTVYINNSPEPKECWTNASLDGFEANTQTYLLNLGLIIKLGDN